MIFLISFGINHVNCKYHKDDFKFVLFSFAILGELMKRKNDRWKGAWGENVK